MLKLTVKRKRAAAAAIAGVLIAAGGGAYLIGLKKPAAASAAEAGQGGGPPPANVQVAEAVTTKLAPLSEAPGSVVSVSDSLIAAATVGKIDWVAEVGAEVKRGDVIARIDPDDARLLRDETRADISRLSSRAAYLTRLVERHESLGDDSGESAAAIDEMRANRDEAQQNLARARVALRRAETNLQRTEVRAPFAGRVAAREAEIGEFASPGAPLVRLVNTEDVEVTARAPDSMLASVKPGDAIRVSGAGESATATVRAIVPVGDQVSRTLELRLALDDPPWPIGSAVEVSLPLAAAQSVVAAERDAVILRADSVYVFTVGADDVARRVDVELGVADGDLVEIIGAVKAGDRLVVRGGERLRDGQKVAIQPAASGAQI